MVQKVAWIVSYRGVSHRPMFRTLKLCRAKYILGCIRIKFSIITQYWDGAVSWNLSSRKTMTCLSWMDNTRVCWWPISPGHTCTATDRRLVGDQSATKNCVGIVYNRCNWSAISRQPVGDQSATCRRPPPTFLRSIWSQRGFTCSNQNLLATKSSLQPSATGRRPVADHLATTLQPPCNQPKFWSQGSRRPVASYVWPGLNDARSQGIEALVLTKISQTFSLSAPGGWAFCEQPSPVTYALIHVTMTFPTNVLPHMRVFLLW